MNRADYLSQKWQPYPEWSKQGQPDFRCGRVLRLEARVLTLWTEDGEETIEFDPTTSPAEAVPWPLLRSGDVVAIGGRPLHAILLSPNLSPEPWSPDVDGDLRWQQWLKRTESFFLRRGYLPVQTPLLVPSPGVDHHIDFMRAQGTRTQRHWTLPTSPEMALKKALCAGHFRVFEIKSCFRDDLRGPWHTPEFTMLEWYWAFTDLVSLQEETRDLLAELSGQKPEVRRVRVADLFQEHLSFSLRPTTTRDELLRLVSARSLDFAEDDDWNDLFFRLWMAFIEPELSGEAVWFVSDFPPQQASLSRLSPEGWSQRFEVYWRGVELANAYHELNDAKANRERFLNEESLRQKRGAELATHDPAFYQGLERGLPPCCGIALGLSRLFRLVEGFDTPPLRSL